MALALLAAAPLAAQVQTPPPPTAPLSAIDWLSNTVLASAPLASNATRAHQPPDPREAPVTGGLPRAQSIQTTVLSGPNRESVGLLPPASTGLPRALWPGETASTVAAAIAALPAQNLPALQTLAIKLLLAEAEAPLPDPAAPAPNPPAPKNAVLLARLDKLLAMGALDQAYALIEAAGPTSDADLFRRAFDASLLLGQEDRACRDMRAARGLAIAAPARIFCAARAGDWTGAQLILGAEAALGRLPAAEAELLGRFLDPEPWGDAPLPPPPNPVTPLTWRIYDALGQTLPTGTLPIAFAHAELSPRAGWKAQAEAAERLARAGVLGSNQLLGIYTAQPPAASGGIWDRIAAFQAFDRALAGGDGAQIARSLPAAYQAMIAAELEVPFAELYGPALAGRPLPQAQQDLALDLGLLSKDYQSLAAAQAAIPGAADQPASRRFLIALAQGQIEGQSATGSLGRAVAAGFAQPAPLPADLADLVAQGRTGMAILTAIGRIETGVLGEHRAVTQGLALLHALGLSDAARRTALQLLLLERRG